ncbi:MAG: hypothetical protein RJA57_506 [Bacteroidota bacterium]
MLKRTTGRLLLTLLIVTGLAGTISSNTISRMERKDAISNLKASQKDLFHSIRGLTDAQLHHKENPAHASIADWLDHLAYTEQLLSDGLKNAMQEPARAEKRASIVWSDATIQEHIMDRSVPCPIERRLGADDLRTPEHSATAMIHLRTHSIRYLKTTTEDLRNRVLMTPWGLTDCYQAYLALAAHHERHAADVRALVNTIRTAAP